VRAALILLALSIARVATAAPTATHPLDDQAGVLSEAERTGLDAELLQLQGSGVDLAVILVRRTGSSIESYARDAATQWTAGKPEASNAAVLVLAIDDRKSRIEVNDTLRPKFPDSRAQAILDNARGYLRNADYGGAVRAISREVYNAARGIASDLESPHPFSGPTSSTSTPTSTPSSTPSTTYTPPKKKREGIWMIVLGLAIVLFISFFWARASRASNFTMSHDGSVNTLQRPFVLDWLWCTIKIIGWVGFVLFIILAATSKSGSSTSSSWGSSSSSSSFDWGSSSSSSSSSYDSGGSSSGGGGWSGGGASSSW